MRKYPKFLAVILAVMFIGVLLLAVFGIHTHYGDVNTTVFLSAEESNTGVGLSSEIIMTFLCPEGTELDDELCDKICGILEKRLRAYGINDSVIAYDKSRAVFSVKLSYNSRTSYDPNIIYGYLGSVGTIEIRAGNEKDDNGLPSGKTADTVIVDNTDLSSVSYSVEGSGSSVKYICDLKYKGNSKKLIQEYTENVVGSEDYNDKVYSIWLDNEMITSRSFSSVIKNGVISAGTSVSTSSSLSYDYTALKMLASAEKLPFELTSSGVFNLSDPDHHEIFTYSLLIVLIAVAVFGLVMIVRYRLAGFAVLLGLIGYLGVSGVVTSGGFDPNLGIYVSKNVFAAFLATTLSLLVLCVVILERIRRRLKEVSAYRAVSEAYGRSERRGAVALCVLLGLTCLAYLASLVIPGAIDLKQVMVAFAAYIVIGYVTTVLGGACVSKSFASTKSLTSEKMYGG